MSTGFLQHYGTPRHSGRYPWGSGKNPFQSEQSMMRYIDTQLKNGKTESEIANEFLNTDGFLTYLHAMDARGINQKRCCCFIWQKDRLAKSTAHDCQRKRFS